jgi:gluconolactonase
MQATVFDERRNILGEGPTATGVKNEQIQWVDIMGKLVRTRHLITGEISEYATPEHVGFAIPRKDGGDVIGTANGPHLRDADGTLHKLPTRIDADGFSATQVVRWNDGKISPAGDLFLGTMGYKFENNAAALYQMRGDGKHMRRIFGDVTISNGLDWTPDGKTMFYIDTTLQRVDKLDVVERDVINRRPFINFPESMGMPDGMSVDANGNLWVAFWTGSAVRCFDGVNGKQLDEISCPTPRITSCVFAGENLDQLIITSAREESEVGEPKEAGMTFMATPGVRGQKTTLFGA